MIATLAGVLACEEPFTPKGEYRDEIVVYAILSNVSDTHYARVYRTYDPPAFDPFEHFFDAQDTSAIVKISDGFSETTFRDTLVTRHDTSRYKDPIRAYVISPLLVQRGIDYRLSITTADNKSTISTVNVPPGNTFLTITYNEAALKDPTIVGSKQFVTIQATFSSTVKGYYFRLMLLFEVFQSGSWIPMKSEVPLYIVVNLDGDEHPVFPRLERSPESSLPSVSAFSYFSLDAYKESIATIKREYSLPVRFTRAAFVLTLVETNLYNYYNIVSGFRDPRSIRVDEPDFTNISNAVGVFGAFTNDSLIVLLPSNL